MPDVVLLGDINIDINAVLPAYPARGSEGVANAVKYHTGGSVVSTAIALSKMSVNTGLIGRLGRDVLSQKILADLDEANIDRSMVQFDPTVSTGMIYVVVNPDGERTMFSARGANVFTEPQDEFDRYLSQARWYHFSGYSLLAEPQQSATLKGLDCARQHRCMVSLDPGPEPSMRFGKQIIALLPKLDVFLPNEQELLILSKTHSLKDGIQFVLDAGARAVVVKYGRQGCIVADDKTYLEIPAFDIELKDTTGAGDSFDAGVIFGRMVGLSWSAAGVLGNALGALASMTEGTGSNLIGSAKTIELIEKDMFKPQWEEMYRSVDQLLTFLSTF